MKGNYQPWGQCDPSFIASNPADDYECFNEQQLEALLVKYNRVTEYLTMANPATQPTFQWNPNDLPCNGRSIHIATGCNPRNGQCDCKPGFHGIQCQIECPMAPDLNGSTKAKTNPCNSVIAHSPNGHEDNMCVIHGSRAKCNCKRQFHDNKPFYLGEACQHACPVGTNGHICSGRGDCRLRPDIHTGKVEAYCSCFGIYMGTNCGHMNNGAGKALDVRETQAHP